MPHALDHQFSYHLCHTDPPASRTATIARPTPDATASATTTASRHPRDSRTVISIQRIADCRRKCDPRHQRHDCADNHYIQAHSQKCPTAQQIRRNRQCKRAKCILTEIIQHKVGRRPQDKRKNDSHDSRHQAFARTASKHHRKKSRRCRIANAFLPESV